MNFVSTYMFWFCNRVSNFLVSFFLPSLSLWKRVKKTAKSRREKSPMVTLNTSLSCTVLLYLIRDTIVGFWNFPAGSHFLFTSVSLLGFGFHPLGKRRNKGRDFLGMVIQFHKRQFSSFYVGNGQCFWMKFRVKVLLVLMSHNINSYVTINLVS